MLWETLQIWQSTNALWMTKLINTHCDFHNHNSLHVHCLILHSVQLYTELQLYYCNTTEVGLGWVPVNSWELLLLWSPLLFFCIISLCHSFVHCRTCNMQSTIQLVSETQDLEVCFCGAILFCECKSLWLYIRCKFMWDSQIAKRVMNSCYTNSKPRTLLDISTYHIVQSGCCSVASVREK